MNDPIHQQIENLREAMRKRYEEGMEAIDRLEKALIGPFPQDTVVRRTPKASRHDAGKNGETTPNEKISNVSKVLNSIRTDFKTIEQISSDTGLDQQHVRYALYQKRAQRCTESRTASGNKKKYRFRDDRTLNRTDEPGVAESVRDVLASSGQPLRPKEIIARLPVQLRNQESIVNNVSAALYNMKQRGKVTHNEDDSTYSLVQ